MERRQHLMPGTELSWRYLNGTHLVDYVRSITMFLCLESCHRELKKNPNNHYKRMYSFWLQEILSIFLITEPTSHNLTIRIYHFGCSNNCRRFRNWFPGTVNISTAVKFKFIISFCWFIIMTNNLIMLVRNRTRNSSDIDYWNTIEDGYSVRRQFSLDE